MSAQNIFLVGPMGAGKTTVGKRLASVLGLSFVDSDHEVEARTGVDIAYIFEREGEAGFRQRETQALEELTQRQGIVLATGGGVVLSPQNRAWLRQRGFVVYLCATVEQQVVRTRRSTHRPLLRTGNRREVLEKLFAHRDPLYREVAHCVVASEGRNARQIAKKIVEQYRQAEAPHASA